MSKEIRVTMVREIERMNELLANHEVIRLSREDSKELINLMQKGMMVNAAAATNGVVVLKAALVKASEVDSTGDEGIMVIEDYLSHMNLMPTDSDSDKGSYRMLTEDMKWLEDFQEVQTEEKERVQAETEELEEVMEPGNAVNLDGRN